MPPAALPPAGAGLGQPRVHPGHLRWPGGAGSQPQPAASGTLFASGDWGWASSWLSSVTEPFERLPPVRRVWVQPLPAAPGLGLPPDTALFLDVHQRWQEVMAAGEGVLLLVRPDGHIAARISAAGCPEQTPEQQERVWQGIWQQLLAKWTADRADLL